MNTETDRDAYWRGRADGYDKLKWVCDSGYLDTFISAGDFRDTDKVLDVGTGKGIVAEALLSRVDTVVGIDISLDMLPPYKISERSLIYQRCDIRGLPYLYSNFFDRVTARMVFHHITKNIGVAMDMCHDALRPRGKLILAEAVSPTEDVLDEYKTIMHLKEERLIFKEDNLIELMGKSGFENIQTCHHTIKQFSVKNWLQNNSLSQELQNELYRLHVEGSDAFKQACNMVVTEDDCLIDSKHLILVGEK